MSATEIARRRSLLFSARIRFSPETQPLRDTAIDKIMEQNLLLSEVGNGLTAQEIGQQGAVCFAGGIPAISHRDVRASLDRLVESGRFVVCSSKGAYRYRLSATAIKELRHLQETVEERFSRVTRKLFRDSDDPAAYAAPFLECLCRIFSQLGESYVRVIKGEVSRRDITSSPSISRAISEIRQKYSDIDREFFESAVLDFFKDSDPDYDTIKWNLAQNYYVAKALGFDRGGHILSGELFGGGSFYFDTNVILHALEPVSLYHKSLRTIGNACCQLNIGLKVCQPTLNELEALVQRQRELLARVVDQIPSEMSSKVRGEFYQIYQERLLSGASTNLDEVFSNFSNPIQLLSELYRVELVDDPWFHESADAQATQQFAKALKEEYDQRHPREKAWNSALHDAQLLSWIKLMRAKESPKTWLVTRDTSLASLLPESRDDQQRALAITLDALLQWLSPMAFRDDVDEDVASIFSEVLKYRLLPQDEFFELKDFLMFAEMEWSCKELPAEDVEGCIRYIKASAADLDPFNPLQREKLSHQISRYFVDPGRKYKYEIQRLEAALEQKDTESLQKLNILEETSSEEIRKRDSRIKEFEEADKKRKLRSLKESAFRRLLVSGVLGIVILGFIVYGAITYGEGNNEVQKLVKTWPLVAFGFGVTGLVGWFSLGEDRLNALGWRIGRLFKK